MFVTEIIFCNDLKSNAKLPMTFYGRNQGDANFLDGLQKDQSQGQDMAWAKV